MLSSDRGTHFLSAMNTEFAKINHFKWLYHTAYRPQSTGALEVQHRVLKDSLFVAVHQLDVQWPTVIQSIVYMLNSMPNSATRISGVGRIRYQNPYFGNAVTNFGNAVTKLEFLKKYFCKKE